MDSENTVITSKYKTMLVRMRPADVEWLDAFRAKLEKLNNGVPFTRSEALHIVIGKLEDAEHFLFL